MCELENEWAFARLPHWAHWHFASGSHWQRGEKCEFFHALLESNQWNPFAGKIWQHPAKLKRHSAYFSAQYLTVFWRHTIASGNKNVHFSSAFNSVNIPPTHGWPVMYSSNRIPYGNLKERAETVHCSMGTPKARCREERKKILRFVYLFERQNYKERKKEKQIPLTVRNDDIHDREIENMYFTDYKFFKYMDHVFSTLYLEHL